MPLEHPDIPLWVIIAVTVVLPLVGYISRGWRDSLQSRVSERIGLSQAQRDFARQLQERVQHLEQQIARLQGQHQRDIAELREYYEARIAELERQLGRREPRP